MTTTDPAIHDLIRLRWSPRSFDARPVERNVVKTLLEATRWAASCYNTQPWRYIVAFQEDEEAFNRLLGCLVEVNQHWAKHAPVLLVSLARTLHDHNGKPNRWAWHDVGAANAQLTAQATAMGLVVADECEIIHAILAAAEAIHRSQTIADREKQGQVDRAIQCGF